MYYSQKLNVENLFSIKATYAVHSYQNRNKSAVSHTRNIGDIPQSENKFFEENPNKVIIKTALCAEIIKIFDFCATSPRTH